MVRLRANGRNIVDQPLPTLLNVTCCVHLHTLLHVVVCCCAKFETGQTFQPTTPNTSFLLRDRRSVAQQCWIRLRSSSNIVGATHAHYAWFTKSYGLYPSHYALQVPTLLAQQCRGLLRPFARSLILQLLPLNIFFQWTSLLSWCLIFPFTIFPFLLKNSSLLTLHTRILFAFHSFKKVCFFHWSPPHSFQSKKYRLTWDWKFLYRKLVENTN